MQDSVMPGDGSEGAWWDTSDIVGGDTTSEGWVRFARWVPTVFAVVAVFYTLVSGLMSTDPVDLSLPSPGSSAEGNQLLASEALAVAGLAVPAWEPVEGCPEGFAAVEAEMRVAVAAGELLAAWEAAGAPLAAAGEHTEMVVAWGRVTVEPLLRGSVVTVSTDCAPL